MVSIARHLSTAPPSWRRSHSTYYGSTYYGSTYYGSTYYGRT